PVLALALLLGRAALAHPDGRGLVVGALRGVRLHPEDRPLESAVRPRAQHVQRLLRVRHREDELGAALVLRGADRRDRARRARAVPRVPALRLRAAGVGADARAPAGGSARAAARVGLYRGADRDDRGELLLPDDAVLLLLRVPGARARPAARVQAVK